MNFKIPDHKLGASVWFVSDVKTAVYGTIQLITLAFSESMTNVYYSLVDSEGTVHNVIEASIVTQMQVPQPKYSVNDVVEVVHIGKDDSSSVVTGTISKIETSVYEDEIDIVYFLEGDDSYWIQEDEILGYGAYTLVTVEGEVASGS